MKVGTVSILYRYFRQDSAAEITARDKLVMGYIKLKLNSPTGLPLDDGDDHDTPARDMGIDKVSHQREKWP